MVQHHCLLALFCLFVLFSAQCSDCCTVFVIPGNLCGNPEATAPACHTVSALRLCSNLTVSRSIVTELSNGTFDVAIQSDGGDIFAQCTPLDDADKSNHIVIMSHQVVKTLTEHVFLSGTYIARAIAELTQQLGWSRIMVVADTADNYFLHTAEEFYRLVNLSSDSNFLQLSNSDSQMDDLVNEVDRLNLRIVVLSLRLQLVSKLLWRARERHLVWPEYAWIVHSVEVSEEIGSTLDGVIAVHHSKAASYNNLPYSNSYLEGDFVNFTGKYTVHNLSHCSMNDPEPPFVSISLPFQSSNILTAHYDHGGLEDLNISGPIPSSLPPQFNPAHYVALYYVCISLCFIVVTVTLLLYFYFRKEPEVKASSVSLSVLIFTACYMLIYYLLVLNSTLLPSYHKRSAAFRNFICVFRVWIHGTGFPIALILSTLLVKLLRIYRIFYCHGYISKYTCGNLALAVYTLLLTLPNAIICLVWSTSDHYLSSLSSSVQDGQLLIREKCTSTYTIQWLLGLAIHIVTMSLVLLVVAIMTRKVKHKNFKDTKKVSALCFAIVLTLPIVLVFWYVLRLLGAHIIAVHGVLQVGHYSVILECMGFIFAPKLFPVVKRRLMHRYCSVPASKGTVTNTR